MHLKTKSGSLKSTELSHTQDSFRFKYILAFATLLTLLILIVACSNGEQNSSLERHETTAGWYLASDVDPTTRTLATTTGKTIHADWRGAWHPEVNKMWLDNCTNFKTNQPSDCGAGYLSDGGPDSLNSYPGPALKFHPRYTGQTKVPAATYIETSAPPTTV